jgi:hypothetical protein
VRWASVLSVTLAAARVSKPLVVTGIVRGRGLRTASGRDDQRLRGYDGGPAHIHMQAGHPKAQGVTTELVFDAPAGTHEFDTVLRDS